MSDVPAITGAALIGGVAERGNGAPFKAVNPASGASLETFHAVDDGQITRACDLARAAFDVFRATPDATRATFLETVAEQVLALGDALIVRAMAESGLPRARLEGERGRTVGQLRLFATLLREGSWRDLRIDSALPTRAPPRPDMRMRLIPLGPVAVFAASNFPLAFSVAGGDTAAAFAAGCPVLLKAHAAHPGTSELVGRAVVRALELCGLPAGVFALLIGASNAVGQALVANAAIQAVGFTGSRSGGVALMAVAAARAQPIPVYAEMSSINPVCLLPGALEERAVDIGAGFAASLTLGVGQFCTNPGLVLGIAGAPFERFAASAAAALAVSVPSTMLSGAIAANYHAGVQTLATQAGVTRLVDVSHAQGEGGAALFRTTSAAFLANPALHAEVFGPAALLVACDDADDMLRVVEQLEGQLTATLQMAPGDMAQARALLTVLERKVGRILVNGYPTGVEVSTAMVHGGPYPATSDGRSTSVGTAAITRFLRPVCYQNLPQELLPECLRDEQAESEAGTAWRLRDGVLGRT